MGNPFSGDATTSARAAPALQPTDTALLQVVLLILRCRDDIEIYELDPDEALVVGRGSDASIQFADQGLSRRHAGFWVDQGVVWVEDLGSTNGTWVNGLKVTRSRVAPTDQVMVGPVVATVHHPKRSLVERVKTHAAFVEAVQAHARSAAPSHAPFAVCLFQFRRHRTEELALWLGDIASLLPPGSVVGKHSAHAVELLVPEADERQLRRELLAVARALAGRRRLRPLLCGVALYPTATDAPAQLIELARTALLEATPQEPEQWAPARTTAATAAAHERRKRPTTQVSVSSSMRELFATVDKVAPSRIPVLIQGETGTGKEVIARLIHERSPRRDEPMVCVNCGAITDSLLESRLFGHERGAFTGAERQTKGVFEEADGGTVLLDEVGELSASAQAALLRVFETQQVLRVGASKPVAVDVRILTATNRDLEDRCREGRFRSDLLFRLNTVTLHVPPLRERLQDIESLLVTFLAEANLTNGCTVSGFSPEVVGLFQQYDWPGNVRELRNVVERAVVLARDGQVELPQLPARLITRVGRIHDRGGDSSPTLDISLWNETTQVSEPREPAEPSESPSVEDAAHTFKDRIDRLEDTLICGALRATAGNKTEAARRLQIPLRTLKHKVTTRNLSPEQHDDPAARELMGDVQQTLERSGGRAPQELSFKELIQAYEAAMIAAAVNAQQGNRTRAAHSLGMPLRTLREKLRVYDLDV